MEPEERKDVFLSYSSKDRPFAARLANDLASFELAVWWDQWEMRVGDSLLMKIQAGIEASAWLAVVLSQSSVGSPWVTRELAAALTTEIASGRVVVLPLLMADCELPPFLRDKVYADFRSSYADGLEALLKRLSPPINPDISKALLSDDETRVRSAWASLSTSAQTRYSRYLTQKMTSQSSADRLAGLAALATIREPSLPARLLGMVTDPSSAVRGRVAFHLGRLRRSEALPAVETLICDRNAAVRSAARVAFQKIRRVRP